MTLTGMNIEAILRVADQLRSQANTLDQTTRTVDGVVRLAGDHWRGHDLDQFRRLWEGQHRRHATHAAQALRDLADTARRNAETQRTTSDTLDYAGGAGGGNGGSGGGGNSEGGSWWRDAANWVERSPLEELGKKAKALLGLPGNFGKALKIGEKLGELYSGAWREIGLLSKTGILRGQGAFGALGDLLKEWKLPAAADELRRLANADDLSQTARTIMNTLTKVGGEGTWLGNLFAEGGRLAPLIESGSKVASTLEAAGKWLGPLGAVLSGVNTVQDFANGNVDRGIYDGIMTAASIAAFTTPPPVDVVAGAIAGVMGGAQLIYDHREAIGDALSSVGNGIVEGAEAVSGWLSDHNPFHW